LLSTPTPAFEFTNKAAPLLFILAVLLLVALIWGLVSLAFTAGLLGIAGAALGFGMLALIVMRV